MNHTIAYKVPCPATGRFVDREKESLLRKIADRLVSACRSRNRRPDARIRVNTFIDETLLDPEIGPEFQRALR
jgi:hypothetical protein